MPSNRAGSEKLTAPTVFRYLHISEIVQTTNQAASCNCKLFLVFAVVIILSESMNAATTPLKIPPSTRIISNVPAATRAILLSSRSKIGIPIARQLRTSLKRHVLYIQIRKRKAGGIDRG